MVVHVATFLLGVRVGYKVLVGELDHTQVKRKELEEDKVAMEVEVDV